MDAIIQVVTSLTTEMFSVGTALVTWVMQTPLALLGVGLFVLIAFVGAIRRLIPGV